MHLLGRARPSELDDQVLAFDIPEIAQARAKRLDPRCRGRGGAETQVSEARTFGLLLCARNQRPREQSRSGKLDQLAAPYGPASRPVSVSPIAIRRSSPVCPTLRISRDASVVGFMRELGAPPGHMYNLNEP